MKNLIFLLGVVCVLISCRTREDLPPRNESGEVIIKEKGINVNFADEVEGIQTIPLAIQGSWEVVEYSKEKTDQTDFFAGFVFTFKPNGTVEAKKGDIVVMGTYKVTPSVDTNDLEITFPATTPFPSLNYTWRNAYTSDTQLGFEFSNKDLVLKRV